MYTASDHSVDREARHDEATPSGTDGAEQDTQSSASSSTRPPSPVLLQPQAQRPDSPKLLRPQAQRPVNMRGFGSLQSLNSSLSFLLQEAAIDQDEQIRSKSRAGASPEARERSIQRARSPWFASEAIQNASIDEQLGPQPTAAHPALAIPPPNRQLAKSTPPVHHDVQRLQDSHPRRTRTPFPFTPVHGRRTPSHNVHERTTLLDRQTDDLARQLRVLYAQDDQDDSVLLGRILKAHSLRSPTPANVPVRPATAAPLSHETRATGGEVGSNEESAEIADDHLLLKGDEHDEQILAKTVSRSSSLRTGVSSQSARPISDEERLQAVIEEFGQVGHLPGDEVQEEKVIASQGAVLVRRVLVRGYMILTTHRLCFLALLPSDPTRHRILQQGAAILHRPGLTRRKRRAWFVLTSDSLTAYPSSTERYEPLGGVRLVDIDDVQANPNGKSVEFRVKGKKCSLEFETVETAMDWQREIDAALFLYTHHVDKIRISVPLIRIAHAGLAQKFDLATMISLDIYDADLPQHRHPRLHIHAEERNPYSTTDLLFGVANIFHSTLPQQLVEAIEPWTEKRSSLAVAAYYTLPAPLIDIDGPRAEADTQEEAKTGVAKLQQTLIRQFSLDCSPSDLQIFKVSLDRTVPIAGTLAIAPHHLCFYRRHRFTGLADTRICIPFADMKSADRGRAFLWRHAAIRLDVRAHEDIVFEMREESVRDRLLALLQTAIKSAANGQDGSKTDEEAKSEEHVKQRSSSKLAKMVKREQKEARFTTSPNHINLLPQVISVRRENRYIIDPMKIHCLTIGSRGDVQPYIELCKRLQKDHHTCTIVSHPEYREWVEGEGILFKGTGGDPGELMKLSVDNNKMLFSPQFYREALSKFRHWLDELLRGIMETCWDAELIIESPSTFGGIHVAEAIGAYYMRAFTMPWTKTSAYPQAFSVPSVDLGPQYNAMSYTLFDQVLWLASSGQVNRWRRHMLHLEPTDLAKLDLPSVPFMYNFSPAVVPPPLDWGDRIKITGYWNSNASNSSKEWEAPEDLRQFLKKGKKEGKRTCYIGFGSITMDDPITVQRSIYEAVKKADVRAVVSKGWSERMMAKASDDDKDAIAVPPEEVYVVDSIPHDWLFPRIDIAMHHGGAGTTGASLKAGLVTLIHPFFGDQYFWAGRVTKLGAGLRVKSLQTDDIADALKRARDERLLREKAEIVGEAIRRERGVDEACVFIYHNLSRARRTKHALGLPQPRTKSSIASTLPRTSCDANKSDQDEEHGEQQATSKSLDPQKDDEHRQFSLGSLKYSLPIRRGVSNAEKATTPKEKKSEDRLSTGQLKHAAKTASPKASKEALSGSVKAGARKEEEAATGAEPAMLTNLVRTQSPIDEATTLQEVSYDTDADEKAVGQMQDNDDKEDDEAKHRRSWYNNALHMNILHSKYSMSVPTLSSMSHLNFLGLHSSHREHSEAAAVAKDQMTEAEKEHHQKEDRKSHISAKQEDQRRRQLLEEEWRKAKRFDLLDRSGRMNVQPEEDDNDEDNAHSNDGDLTETETSAQHDALAAEKGTSALESDVQGHHQHLTTEGDETRSEGSTTVDHPPPGNSKVASAQGPLSSLPPPVQAQ